MKPRYGDVCELAHSMDFSHVSLDLAMEAIQRGPDDYCSVTLGVNASGLIKAIDLCRLYKLELALSTTYERDEWSLEYISSTTTSTCWSPGA